MIHIVRLLPLLLRSAKYTPSAKEVEILTRLINRMRFLRSNSFSVRELAKKAVDECQLSHQRVNPTVEWFANKWGWNKEKLIDVLELLWKELK